MTLSLIRKITPIGTQLPEIGTKTQGVYRADMMLQGVILEALARPSRLVAGLYDPATGNLSEVVVQFVLASGAVELVSFSTINLVPGVTRTVYFADRATGTIISQPLEGQDPGPLNDLYTDGSDLANRGPTEDLFPLLHVGQHPDTATTSVDFALWIGPKKKDDTPVGSIMAWMPGFFFNNGANGGFTVGLGLTANSVAAANAYLNPRGWHVCDGSPLNLPYSPIFKGTLRYLPRLTDERFLMGSTGAGGAGGNNNNDHTHLLPAHIHGAQNLNTAYDGLHSHTLGVRGSGNFASNITVLAGTSSGNVNVINRSGMVGAGSIGDWGAVDAGNHHHAIGGYVGQVGNSGSNGDSTLTSVGASVTENRPKYLSTFFIIKVI